ncbi:ammonium transporter Rh type A [Galendromus occidentalis]|uniref:Ammonium transporter Rh type A n=1 Tax=Galendromus occidentalis TaxID=34638 RepID=A0AAJ7SDU0_9ACAR|nr:ammonium transporter Rh type A [Galendromus occidentalis]
MSDECLVLAVFFAVVAALYIIVARTIAAEKRASTFLEEQADKMDEEELEDFGLDPTDLQSHIFRIRLLKDLFSSATVSTSFGVVIGKASWMQFLVMAVVEASCLYAWCCHTDVFACDELIGVELLNAVDIGGSIFMRTFGAYSGLAVSRVIYGKYRQQLAVWEDSNRGSNPFTMIDNNSRLFVLHSGTPFLWMYRPSFNAIGAQDDARHRAVLNMYLCLYFRSHRINHEIDDNGKLPMVNLQNATLTGGVAVGALPDMPLFPTLALGIGTFAGTTSVLGYTIRSAKTIRSAHGSLRSNLVGNDTRP